MGWWHRMGGVVPVRVSLIRGGGGGGAIEDEGWIGDVFYGWIGVDLVKMERLCKEACLE